MATRSVRIARAVVLRMKDAAACGGIDALAVRWADDDVVDEIEVFDVGAGQPRPRRAAVGGFENACASDQVHIEVAFAGSGINHVGIFRVHRQRADGDVGDQISQRRPALPAVVFHTPPETLAAYGTLASRWDWSGE